MKRRHYIGMLYCLMIMACGKPSPNYDKEVLIGNWLRINSSDARSDSMTVYIESGDSAIVTFVPPSSNFFLKQRKWHSITAIAEFGDFQFLDLSADSNLWKAFIIMKSKTELRIKSAEYPNAPGGTQTWVKF
ncbi:MAG: hypothetical protein JKY03_10830 [Aureispira sp.]|nr:hypothetical protein [Aureispira sp.]